MEKLQQRVTDFNNEMNKLRFCIKNGKGFKEEYLSEVSTCFALPLPNDFCNFYRTFENLYTDNFGNISYEFMMEDLLIIRKYIKDMPEYMRWKSMGLVDMLENKISDYRYSTKVLDEEIIKKLNTNYQYIGYFCFDEEYNEKNLIYFDSNQKYGILNINILDLETVNANLNAMAAQSPAHQGLEDLLIEVIDGLANAIKAKGQTHYIEEEPNVKTDADKQVFDTIKIAIKKATKLANKNTDKDKLNAVEIYKSCIEQLEKANQTEGYNYIFCHNEIFNFYNTNVDDYSISQTLLFAHKTLNLLPKNFSFSDKVNEYYRESLIHTSCLITHLAYRNESDTEKLEAVIEIANKAIWRIYYSSDFIIIAKKVFLLLKLNRTEEAFETTQFALDKAKEEYTDFDEEDFYELIDIINSNDFKEWQKKQRQGELEKIKLFIENSDRIFDNVQKQAIENKQRTFEEQIPSKEIIDYIEAVNKYGIYNRNNRKEGSKKLVFLGDVYIKGNFDRTWFDKQLQDLHWEGNLYGVLITGNLYIDGDYIDSSNDEGIELKVMGNMECNWIFSEDGYISIKGNLTAKYGISGNYNHGTLETNGKVYAPYILNSDHDMEARSETEFIYMDGGNNTDKGSLLIVYKNGSKVENSDYHITDDIIHPKIWNEDNEFQLQVFIGRIKNGENPFVVPEN